MRSEYPEALNNLGICLKEVERYERSEIVLRLAVSMQPGFAGAWLNLGNTLNEQEKFEEAITSYRKAIELRPDFADAYLNLGNTLNEQEKFEEAIASYKKVIELQPDCVAAYFLLGDLLKELGKLTESREVVATLLRIMSFDDGTLIAINDKTLVFDWRHRKALALLMKVELAAAEMEVASSLAAVERVEALCLPPLFLEGQVNGEGELPFYEKGYLVEKNLVSPDLCTQLIAKFNNGNELMSPALINMVATNGIFRSALEKIHLNTGFPHLIWNCIYFAKGPDDKSASDAWHYDNHYNKWTPKLMIYLNSQREEGGAAHFVEASLSRAVSEKSDYMGLVCQRDSYGNQVKSLVKELRLSPFTLDPEYVSFSPDQPGSGVWFCPARVLHRGVSPKKGMRHVLSFSLTPLPADCGWSVDHCVQKSIEILQDKIRNGMQKADINPYWISDEEGSD